MSEVKRYHLTEAGLVEGVSLGRLNVVLAADYEVTRVREHELQQRLTAADERVDRLEAGLKWETERNELLLASLTEAEDMLSVTSLEAGQRIEVLEGLLRRAAAFTHDFQNPISLRRDIDAALKPAEDGGDEAI